jgi:Cys-tRNA(Pro)/Cys-tRNA(Cys) deacylase
MAADVVKGIGKTLATRALDAAGVGYDLHLYEYRDAGEIGLEAAAALGVEPKRLFKAVVLQDRGGSVLALVPSNRRVAPGKLMKALGRSNRPSPVAPARAQSLTGYLVGGISPLGLKHRLQICIDSTAFEHAFILANAGRRGLMMELSPQALAELAGAKVADIVEDSSAGGSPP